MERYLPNLALFAFFVPFLEITTCSFVFIWVHLFPTLNTTLWQMPTLELVRYIYSENPTGKSCDRLHFIQNDHLCYIILVMREFSTFSNLKEYVGERNPFFGIGLNQNIFLTPFFTSNGNKSEIFLKQKKKWNKWTIVPPSCFLQQECVSEQPTKIINVWSRLLNTCVAAIMLS